MRKIVAVLALLVLGGIVAAIVPAQESDTYAVEQSEDANENLAGRLQSIGDDPVESGETEAANAPSATSSSRRRTTTFEPPAVKQGEPAGPREPSVLQAPRNFQPEKRTPARSLESSAGSSVSEGGSLRQTPDEPIGSSVLQLSPSDDRTSTRDQAAVKGVRSSRRQLPVEKNDIPEDSQPQTRRSLQVSPRGTQGSAGRRSQLIQSWGPTLRVEATGPRDVVVGKEASYIINVINSGKVDANDVFLRVALPTWVQVVSNSATTGTAEIKEDAAGVSRLVWSVPLVASGRDEQIKLRFVARENRPVKMTIDWVLKPIVKTAQINVQKPQVRLNLTGPSDMMLGDKAEFSLVVSNPGTGPAENVVVSITTDGSDASSKSLGSIPANGKRTLKFDLTANDPGRMSIKANVTADGGLADKLVENIQIRSPKLKVRIAGPRLKFAGTTARYELRISNQGNATANNVVAKLKLPAGAKYAGGLPGAKPVAGGISWTIGRLEAKGERVFNVKTGLVLAGDNQLQLSAQSQSGSRVRGSFTTRVEALADLKLVVNDPQGPQTVGKEVVYEVHLTNRGTKAAENIDVTVQFSKGIEPLRATGAKADVIPGQVLFKQIPRLGAGRKITLKIVARADKAGNHRFRAQVECKDPETQLASEDTTRFFGETIQQATGKRSTERR